LSIVPDGGGASLLVFGQLICMNRQPPSFGHLPKDGGFCFSHDRHFGGRSSLADAGLAWRNDGAFWLFLSFCMIYA
jgi:hypothetical protein